VKEAQEWYDEVLNLDACTSYPAEAYQVRTDNQGVSPMPFINKGKSHKKTNQH
jgi:hypothetical protein